MPNFLQCNHGQRGGGVCAGDNGPEFDATVARSTSASQDLLATPPADTTGGPR